jgi:hypothetical protein
MTIGLYFKFFVRDNFLLGLFIYFGSLKTYVLKKSIVIFLLFSLLFQAVGAFYLFKIWQWHLKSEAKHYILNHLPDNQIVRLKLNPEQQKQLHWEDESEFIYLGQWYDVIKQEKSEDFTLYDCYLDKKEASLVQKFSYLIDNQWIKKNNPFQQGKHLLKKILEQTAYLSTFSYSITVFLIFQIFVSYTHQSTDNQLVILNPPPELF